MTIVSLPIDIRAVHEAGHAVVADRLGILAAGPAAVSIEVTTEDTHPPRVFGGYCKLSPEPWPDDVTQETFDQSWLPIVEKRLGAFYAGQLAEEIFYGGHDSDNSGRDTEGICRLCTLLGYAVRDWDAQDNRRRLMCSQSAEE